jgi:hypothetical protein
LHPEPASAPEALLAGRAEEREDGEHVAQAVGLADELLKALLDLFTQTVDHVPLPRLGEADRTYRPREERAA